MNAADLLAARAIVKETLKPEDHRRCRCRDEIDAGEWDRGQKVRAALYGIHYGREQAARIAGQYPLTDHQHANPAVAFNAATNIAGAIRALSRGKR